MNERLRGDRRLAGERRRLRLGLNILRRQGRLRQFRCRSDGGYRYRRAFRFVPIAVQHHHPRNVRMLAAPVREVHTNGLLLIALRIFECLTGKARPADVRFQRCHVLRPGLLYGDRKSVV